eukprot:CAMPEP_0197042712 /NCGR_PEP_ID=MMETSP1384-20130603/19041_1 /TAXON_ID=29189 /ORGANISM="Ammonia sp." /LENGTH=112 /DNA_ID=CAMNT_0042473871 /DNA_START=108 /DNA_END=446 /DNA_ORIENTATION=-
MATDVHSQIAMLIGLSVAERKAVMIAIVGDSLLLHQLILVVFTQTLELQSILFEWLCAGNAIKRQLSIRTQHIELCLLDAYSISHGNHTTTFHQVEGSEKDPSVRRLGRAVI